MTERTPWPVMLSLARQIGIEPSAFWRLSLREWRALAAPSADALSRAAFADLARRFPDTSHG
ncbi:MAG: phage tail assembly chaperone [Hyphomonadaceae bacterium]